MKIAGGPDSTSPKMSMQSVYRGIGWLLCVIIVILTFVPPSFRPVTHAPHVLEHLTIFLVTGLAFGMGYPNRRSVCVIAFVIFAAVLEIGQIWDPGRHARFRDFVANVLGTWLGLYLSFIWSRANRGGTTTGRTT
jgi:VanZ family protein